jgi:hypothetical protein
MNWWKKFPWRRLLALLLVVAVLVIASTYARGETMYVKVNASNPDAVIMSSTDFFEAEPVATLIQNQPVETTGKKDGEYAEIEATVDGKKVKGWVKAIILQKKPLENVSRVSETGAVENASFAGNGLNEKIQAEMRAGSPEMDAAMKRLDDFEAKRAKLLDIKNWDSATDADSTGALKHYRDFGAAGGLR